MSAAERRRQRQRLLDERALTQGRRSARLRRRQGQQLVTRTRLLRLVARQR